MAKLSKKEFAAMCRMTTKILSTNIIRKKVVVGEDNMIDLDEGINTAFYLKNKKEETADTQVVAPAEKAPVGVVLKMQGTKIDDASGVPDYATSEKRLKHLDTQKREEEIRKLRLQVEKMNGEVIPSAVIAPLFFQHSQSLMTAFKIATEEQVRTMGKRYGMTAADISEMRGVIIRGVNDAMVKAEEITVSALSGIVAEYQEKKGVGERN